MTFKTSSDNVPYMIQSSQSDLRVVDASASSICFLGNPGPDVQLHLRAESWSLPFYAAKTSVSKHCLFKPPAINHLFSIIKVTNYLQEQN